MKTLWKMAHSVIFLIAVIFVAAFVERWTTEHNIDSGSLGLLFFIFLLLSGALAFILSNILLSIGIVTCVLSIFHIVLLRWTKWTVLWYGMPTPIEVNGWAYGFLYIGIILVFLSLVMAGIQRLIEELGNRLRRLAHDRSTVSVQVRCPACLGKKQVCGECMGSGRILVPVPKGEEPAPPPTSGNSGSTSGTCTTCGGSGYESFPNPWSNTGGWTQWPCSTCDGSGVQEFQSGGGYWPGYVRKTQKSVACNMCKGSGNGNEPCRKCKGIGHITRKEFRKVWWYNLV